MAITRSSFWTRYAPLAAFGLGVAFCFSFWLGVAALATGAYRSQGPSVSLAQAREALFQSARDLTEGRSSTRTAR